MIRRRPLKHATYLTARCFTAAPSLSSFSSAHTGFIRSLRTLTQQRCLEVLHFAPNYCLKICPFIILFKYFCSTVVSQLSFLNSGKEVFLLKTAFPLINGTPCKCFNAFPFAFWWSLPTAAQQQFNSHYFSVQLHFLTCQTLTPQGEPKITPLCRATLALAIPLFEAPRGEVFIISCKSQDWRQAHVSTRLFANRLHTCSHSHPSVCGRRHSKEKLPTLKTLLACSLLPILIRRRRKWRPLACSYQREDGLPLFTKRSETKRVRSTACSRCKSKKICIRLFKDGCQLPLCNTLKAHRKLYMGSANRLCSKLSI